MAGWLSSWLNDAEQFLEQLDGQDAESFGKPEKQGSTALENISEQKYRTVRGKPKQPSDLLYEKKKSTLTLRQESQGENLDASLQTSVSGLSRLSKSAHGARGFNGSGKLDTKDPSPSSKRQPSSVSLSTQDSGGVGRDDWTELLASPNINFASSPALSSSVGSSDSSGRLSSRAASYRVVSNTGRNGGYYQKSVGSSSKNFGVANRSLQVLTISSEMGLMDSEKESAVRTFRNEDLRRRLELDANSMSGIVGDLKVGVTKDGSQTTTNGIGLDAHSVEVGNSLSIAKPDLVSEGELLNNILDYKRDLREIMDGSEVMQNAIGDNSVNHGLPSSAFEHIQHVAERTSNLDLVSGNGHGGSELSGQPIDVKEPGEGFGNCPGEEVNSCIKDTPPSSTEDEVSFELKTEKYDLKDEIKSLGLPGQQEQDQRLEMDNAIKNDFQESTTAETSPAFRESDTESDKTGSETETESAARSESEDEELERRKSAHKRRIAKRKEMNAAKAAAAQAAIREREDFVQKLEKEKGALERILAEREEQQGKEAAELRLSMTELLQALEWEKQEHNSTRMKALAMEAQLENQNAELAKSLGAVQWELENQIAHFLRIRSMVEAKEVMQAELERRLAKAHCELQGNQQNEECKLANWAHSEEYSFEEEHSALCQRIQCRQIQVKELESKLGDLRDSRRVPSQAEVELENHLAQLTDHLIQKQAQVEAVSTEKATLAIRLEAVSNALQEERAMTLSLVSRSKTGVPKNFEFSVLDEDMENGLSRPYSSKNKPFAYEFHESAAIINSMSSLPFPPLLRQLDAVFSAGIIYLRRHRWAYVFAFVYMIGLHLWVLFILFMQSKHTQTMGLQDLALPGNTNGLSGGSNA